MLRFDNFPPAAFDVHFVDGIVDKLVNERQNKTAVHVAGLMTAGTLLANCVTKEDAELAFNILAGEFPKSGITDADNGVDDLMSWHPQDTFVRAGSQLFVENQSQANVEGVTV